MAASIFTLLLCLAWMPTISKFEKTGANYFQVYLNNISVGYLGDESTGKNLLAKARREVVSSHGEPGDLTFIDVDLNMVGSEVLFGEIDSERSVMTRMEEILKDSIRESLQPSCTVKIDDYMVNLGSQEEARELLQAVIDKYDESKSFEVKLVQDSGRDFTVMTAQVERQEAEESEEEESVYTGGGLLPVLDAMKEDADKEAGEADFSDYELGVTSMDFVEDVEISESYLPASRLTPLEEAIDYVTKEEDKPSEYTVVQGDTLGGIMAKLEIPLEDLIEMNAGRITSVNSIIHVGDTLVYMVPEPELAVARIERCYYEEVYDADIIYIDRDDWYTTQTNVIQQPSAGFRKVVVDETYQNDQLLSRNILKEEIVMDAVPKIMERGTIVPPTYIKPLSGGTVSSPFGYRNIGLRGASTYHKGVDWYVPVGTPVYASSGGVVRSAGWGSGYGYVIYVDHPDGRQTRYAHLSKILVSAGQSVTQGQIIGRSGATGNVTGPHLHFEILINGTQVNPLNYVPR